MAEIGNGYGSEFQLMRFLGHHRNELNSNICEKLNSHANISWLDFPYDKKKKSGDSEYVGVDFLKGINEYAQIKKAWSSFWPQANKAPNWDGIGIQNNKWLLIEAKAHKNEMVSNCQATEESKIQLREKINELKNNYNIITQNDWLKRYYQKANRLLFIKFLEDNNINASIIYIYFINGFLKKSIRSKNEWENLIKIQDEYLGILNNNWVKQKVYNVFIECIK